jgi:hydrogenase maturation factor HypF (carbamoyltransferase family)
VPVPVALAEDGPTVLALGAYLKNTVCVLKGREAFLSQHVGGLDNAAAIGFLEETVEHLLAILDVKPEIIAHDLHPDFPSTHLAVRLAERFGVPARAVGHHAAHWPPSPPSTAWPGHGLVWRWMASASARTVAPGAVSCCGWTRADCARLGHLQPLRLPGGERAAASPGAWRLRPCTTAGWAHAWPTGWGAPGRIAMPGLCSPCSPATCAVRRRPAWAAGSMRPPPCSACADVMVLRGPGGNGAGRAGGPPRPAAARA